MTALNQYERLEASGIWRETPQSKRRDVIVSFGNATLILTDPRSDIPLTHWSLPAVSRLNPGKMPALYSPGGEGTDEELEIEDDLMIRAMEKVHRVIEARRPHPGRLRQVMTLTAALSMLLLAVFWLPQALTQHAANVGPPAQKAAIGQSILNSMTRSTGPVCQRPSADPALRRLAERLLGPGQDIVVLRQPMQGALRLPGPITIIANDLLTDQSDPEVLAGYILAAQSNAGSANPLLAALRDAGIGATFQLLTSGALPKDALKDYGRTLLAKPMLTPDDEDLLARFAKAGVSSQPYARALDPSGETTLALIEADPFRTTVPGQPVIDQRSWLVLQQICAD